MTDAPHAHVQPALNNLAVTVQAPASTLSDADGQIRAAGMSGLYVCDLRVLTQARLTFGGREPHHLAQLPEGAGRTRFVAVAHGFGDPTSDPTVRIERTRCVVPDGMVEEISISSTASSPVRADLVLELACDLASIDVAKSGRGAESLTATASGAQLSWRAHGVAVTATGPEGEALPAPARLRWPVRLDPGQRRDLTWRVHLNEQPSRLLAAPTRPPEWSRPRVSADDRRLVRLLDRSLDDLASLRLTDTVQSGGHTFLAAGAPWFLTLFGRDSIWSARMLLPLGTELAEGTLRTLARRQGRQLDPASGEAPGKIMHELRHPDPHRAVRPAGHPLPSVYYGTVDATLLWISLLAEAWRWGMPEPSVAELLPALDQALRWVAEYSDPDGDGFIEYIDTDGRGLANQGWKDSFDAVRFHDGSLATPPIALCEVQGYAYRAALDAAELLDAFRGAGAGDRWLDYAAGLANRFRQRFWVDGALGPFPALALDATGRPVDSLTSNIGHLLGTGLLNPDEEAIVARLIAAPPLAAGYGLRTMSTLDAGYAPLSYHCGSVWPHDTAIALLGLSAVRADQAASRLSDGLLAAAEAFEYRLPELYGGEARDEVPRPVPYPGACHPQAWSAAASVTVLHAALGLAAHVPHGEVRVRVPRQRDFGAIAVDGLRIAGAVVSVAIDRNGEVRVAGLPPYLRLVVDAPVPVSIPDQARRPSRTDHGAGDMIGGNL